jgi:hypothetical protein
VNERNLSRVPAEKQAKQDKDSLGARWPGVKRLVKSDLMLRSLERGDEGSKTIEDEDLRGPNYFLDEAGLYHLIATREIIQPCRKMVGIPRILSVSRRPH